MSEEPAFDGANQRRDAQFNTRLSPEHRRRLEVLVTEHPRRRATLRDVIEDLIDEAYERREQDHDPATSSTQPLP